MTFSSIIRMAIDEIARKKKQFFFQLILLIVGIILIGASIYLYNVIGYSTKICDESFRCGNDRTYYMEAMTNSEFLAMDINVINEIRHIDGLSNFGQYYFASVAIDEIFKDVSEMQKNSPYIIKDENYGEYNMAGISMNADMLGLCDIKLVDGSTISSPNKYEIYMYLGKELSSIPIGTEYNTKYFKYVVKGHIENSVNWVDRLVHKIDMEPESYYYNLDQLIIFVENDTYLEKQDSYYFCIEEGYNKDIVIGNLNEVLNKHDISYSVGNYEYIFEKREEKNKRIADILVQLAVIILISVISIQICVQSSDILSNSKKYGIMYANGVTKSDLRKIILVQSIIKLLLAFIMAALITYILLSDTGANNLFFYNLIYILKKYVLLKVVAITVGTVLIGTIVPLILLESMPPVKLMKEIK